MLHPEAFLADVLEHPQDDGPRLRYADWLEERCDPLGEFIRVQCRLADLPASEPCVLELETRQRELLAEFEEGWVGELADWVDWWTFRRGFIEEVGASAAQFLAHAADLFQRAPIQEIHLGKVRDQLEPLAASAFLGKTRHLDLSNNHLRDQGARVLAASPHLAQVRGLNLSSSGIGDPGLRALASSPFLPELRELYLSDNRICSPGARALARSPLADSLSLLHLRFNPIGDDGAALLQERLGHRVLI